MLNNLGNEGWELVAAIPISSGSVGMTSYAATDSALGLFKRAKGA